uniref:Bulb-type lectin domain-containing protein n=1 Tax=Fagus sylvatica TaxID=28930 RepID=A0A2N9I9M0_FAGSY
MDETKTKTPVSSSSININLLGGNPSQFSRMHDASCMGDGLLLFLILLPYMLHFPPKFYLFRPQLPPHHQSQFHINTNIGTFLLSQNGNFKATIDAKPPSSDYYFSIAPTFTHAEIWTANRNAPMSSSDKLSLTTNGLIVTNQTGQVLWSTPFLTSKVAAMQLLDTGNLVNSKALKNSNGTVSWMVMNDTGLYLLGSDGSTVVIQRNLDCARQSLWVEFVLVLQDSIDKSAVVIACLENTSLSLPSACNGSQLNSSISYLKLGPGFYHENASGSCYLLENHLGSFSLTRLTPFNNPRLGKNRLSKIKTVKQGQFNSSSSEELEMISIPGLPRRFDYEELAAATEELQDHMVGSGGFGTVYKRWVAFERAEGGVTKFLVVHMDEDSPETFENAGVQVS